MRKKVIMARVVKLKDADDSFDLEFWQKVGPEGMFKAMSQMVHDYYKIKGYGHPPRLRRTVAVLKRREG